MLLKKKETLAVALNLEDAYSGMDLRILVRTLKNMILTQIQ